MTAPRALFASPVQPIGGCSPDIYTWNKTARRFRHIVSFLDHPGLSFLAANVPGVEILPYPTWDDFRREVARGWDVLGISFYLNETDVALEMARYARAQGVKEVWAGNFGAYSPMVEPHFDRVIHGWGEAPVARALGLEPLPAEQLVHPPIYSSFGFTAGIEGFTRLSVDGILFTSRGCPFTCNFCQTPDFYGKATRVPLESIDRVLAEYANNGISRVNLLDENFGTFPEHSQEVVRLLHKYGMRFIPLCRVDVLLKHHEEWTEMGLLGAHLGVESLNQTSLTGANKRLSQAKTEELLRTMSRHNQLVQAFYMIGFDDESAASIRDDIAVLANLDVDLPQVQVVTPYPRTEHRRLIEDKYGIFDHTWSHYNSRFLVWNHPKISPAEMSEVQTWANQQLVTGRQVMRTGSKLMLHNGTRRLDPRILWKITRGKKREKRHLYETYARPLASSRAWAQRGWDRYEDAVTGDAPKAGEGAMDALPQT